jgi:hypothetical protein
LLPGTYVTMSIAAGDEPPRPKEVRDWSTRRTGGRPRRRASQTSA